MPRLEWLDPSTEAGMWEFNPKKLSTATFPMRKFPSVTLLGLWMGLGGQCKVSVGNALQGFGIPEFWEETQSQNYPDTAFL